MAIQYDYIDLILPKEIFFITSQELEDLFPDNTPKEREYYITKAKRCCMYHADRTKTGKKYRLENGGMLKKENGNRTIKASLRSQERDTM